MQKETLLCTLALAFAPHFCCAQQLALTAPMDALGSATTSSASIVAPATPARPVEKKPLTDRWLELDALSHSERYRSSTNQGGWHVFEDGQQRSLVQGRIKLDGEDRYSIAFRASSGRYFNWAFADFAGPGLTGRLDNYAAYPYAYAYTPAEFKEIYTAYATDPVNVAIFATVYSNGWEFYLRELAFHATPVKALTVEFGSLGIERGLATEITTFDDDGWISGERVRFHAPEHLYFDEVGYTNAFFGDRATPNLFQRGSSFQHANYHQAFVRKQFVPRLGVSADYTWQTGTDTLRQAAIFDPEVRIADKVHVETYQRLNSVTLQGLDVHGGSGFAIFADKRLNSRLNGDLGFAAIDKDYSVYSDSRYFHAYGFSFNGDAYGQGKRPFAHAAYKVTPFITAYGFYTHAVGPRVLNLNKQGIQGGINFDFKALVNAEKRVF